MRQERCRAFCIYSAYLRKQKKNTFPSLHVESKEFIPDC